jgi:hypothetical protein
LDVRARKEEVAVFSPLSMVSLQASPISPYFAGFVDRQRILHRMRYPHQNLFLVLCYLPFLVFIFPLYMCVADSIPSKYCKVELVDQKIKLDVSDETFENVLLAIYKQTGIEFILGNEHSEKLVTRSVELLPVAAFLRRIFAGYNYVVMYDVNKRPIQVKIFKATSDYAYSHIKQNPGQVSTPNNKGSEAQRRTRHRKEAKLLTVTSDMNKVENLSIEADETFGGTAPVETVEIQPPSESYDQMILISQAPVVGLESQPATESFEQMIIMAPIASPEERAATPKAGIMINPASDSYKQMIIASPAKNIE